MWFKSKKSILICFLLFSMAFLMFGSAYAEETGYNESLSGSQSIEITDNINNELFIFNTSFSGNNGVEGYSAEDFNDNNNFHDGSLQLDNQTLEDFSDWEGCCSLIIHVSDGHDVIAHRRDSSGATKIYINDSYKIGGIDAIEQYKTYNMTKDFFHLIVTADGWMIGAGGTGGNLELETLAAKIMNYGSINDAFLNEAFKFINTTMKKGHFQIKSPDNHVGIVIINKEFNRSYCDLLEMGDGDFSCCPNDPYYFQWGKYTTINVDPVLAAINIVGKDAYAKTLRRDLITYDVIKDFSSTKISIFASFDGGTLVNGSGEPDNIFFRGVTVSGQSLPRIPDKLTIGQVIFIYHAEPIPVPSEPTSNLHPQPVNAKVVGMQKTGATMVGIVLAILMVLGGLISSQKKQ